MTPRFVLDEWSWRTLSAQDISVLSNAISQFLERLDTARERREIVFKHEDFYLSISCGNLEGLRDPYSPITSKQFDRDLIVRLQIALDRIEDFDDTLCIDFDVELEGSSHYSPGMAWAHARCLQEQHVAILPLFGTEIPSGKVTVEVNGKSVDMTFVTDEQQHVEFFRSLICLENADEMILNHWHHLHFQIWTGSAKYGRGLKTSAFPTLKFVAISFDIWGDSTIRGPKHSMSTGIIPNNWHPYFLQGSELESRTKMAQRNRTGTANEIVLVYMVGYINSFGGMSRYGLTLIGFIFGMSQKVIS